MVCYNNVIKESINQAQAVPTKNRPAVRPVRVVTQQSDWLLFAEQHLLCGVVFGGHGAGC